MGKKSLQFPLFFSPLYGDKKDTALSRGTRGDGENNENCRSFPFRERETDGEREIHIWFVIFSLERERDRGRERDTKMLLNFFL